MPNTESAVKAQSVVTAYTETTTIAKTDDRSYYKKINYDTF